MNDMQPDNNPMPHSAADEAANDREGAMAKADLHKLANYSIKLFKKIQDEDQLEGWVQAKITKAADYIASVYHYLEYEMKFSEYGEHLANAEVMSEDKKEVIKNKLMEAKAKVAELKKLQAEKLKKDKKEKKVSEAKSCNHTAEGKECPVHGMKECGSMEEGFDEKAKTGDTFKTQHGVATKTATGLKHTRTSKPEDDEDYVPPKKEKKTAMTGAERREQKAKDKEQDKESKAYEKKHPGSVKRYVDGKQVNESDKGDMDKDGKDEPDSKEYMDNKDAAIKKAMGKKDKKVSEAAKPDFLDMDKDGNKKEPMKKAVADKKKGAVKEEMKVGDKKSSSTGGTIEKTKTGVKHTAGKNYGGETAEKEEKKKVKESAELIAESTEVSRLKELTQRLIG